MEKPIRIYSAAKEAELHVIRGKLEAHDIEAFVENKSFQGAGLLHQLIVSEKDVEQAIALIKEGNPQAHTTQTPVSQGGGVTKKGWSITFILLLLLFFWFFFRRWLLSN